MDRLEAFAARLKRGLQHAKHVLGLRRIVGRQIADVDVDAHEARLRPGMNGHVRFGEQDRARHALRLELEEALADDGEAGIARRVDAQLTQRVGLREFRRVGQAAVPFAQQMDPLHSPSFLS